MHPYVRHRWLPHWDFPGSTFFITTCLQGSIPASGLLDIHSYRIDLQNREPPDGKQLVEWDDLKFKLRFARADSWLDKHHAVIHLADTRIAQIVLESLLHFEGVRYTSHAYATMPSHLHWVFRPLESWVTERKTVGAKQSPREQIMQGMKTFTARECNKVLGRNGTFWQAESYDHCVRDDQELLRIIEYVEMNPVRAGLVQKSEDWRFSSASTRIGEFD